MDKVCCNRCGKNIKVVNEIAREDYFQVKKQWGYFSKKDGITQEFIICEECMEKIEQSFAIAPKEYETMELL